MFYIPHFDTRIMSCFTVGNATYAAVCRTIRSATTPAIIPIRNLYAIGLRFSEEVRFQLSMQRRER